MKPKSAVSEIPRSVIIGLLSAQLVLESLIAVFSPPSPLSRWLVWLLNMGVFTVLIPGGFVIGSRLMNRFLGENIAKKNALGVRAIDWVGQSIVEYG